MTSHVAVEDVAARFEFKAARIGSAVHGDQAHLVLEALDQEGVLLYADLAEFEPDGPGIGIALNEDFVARYRVA